MQVSETLLGYVKNTYCKIKSNLLITDLKKVLLVDLDINLKLNNYLGKTLNANLQEIIKEWKDKKYSEKMFISTNDNLIAFIVDDNTKYSAQMVFPIYHQNKLDGLVLFFRTSGNYIPSSSKAPKIMRLFIEEFSDKNFKVKGD